MLRRRWITWLLVLLLGAPGAALAEGDPDSEASEGQASENAPTESGADCFPACRSGYVCHPKTHECVSICNPSCAAWEVCSADAQCITEGDSPEGPPAELGDKRFRIVLLGRFGFAGKFTTTIIDPFAGGPTKIKGKPEKATLGFDLRIEKPVAKHVSVGGVLSNYWLRGGTEAIYALDIAPFVKPRAVFRAGKQEAEFYGLIQVGGSLVRLPLLPETQTSGGFNVGIMPGFQVFIGRAAAFVVEVGYAFSWFKGQGEGVLRIWVGQPTVRTGFAFAF